MLRKETGGGIDAGAWAKERVAVNEAWRVGQVVDERYEVVEAHEGGGMGVVYRVRHLEWGTDLAVKCPRAELFDTAAQRDRFISEAEIWVSLGLHPNVCGCHYVRILDGVPRVFAEYVAGGSLAEWIADRRLYSGEESAVLSRVLDIAIQMAWGLEHAHAHQEGGLVHQDVKPANVLLDVSPDGELTAKVTDFGLAKARGVAASAAGHDATDASVLVTVGGMTLAYASPEQADQVGVGRRSDIYSFAVSVLEMFTGGVTWMAGSVAGAALAAHRASRPSDPDLPDLPAEVASLLERCLHRDFRHRPSSMAAVAGELVAIYHQAVGKAYPRALPAAADLRSDELNNHGLSLLDLGRQTEAAKAFEAAITADPRHLEATYNDGLHQWRSGTITDDALVSRLEAARAASGDSWLARYLLAEVHLERGDLAAANELLRSIEDMAPEQPKVARALRTARTERPVVAAHATTRTMSWHEYEGPGIPSMEIRFTADGRRALAVSGRNLGLWDIGTGQCSVRLSGQERGPHIDVSADGRFALYGAETQVRLWDLANGRVRWKASTRAKSYAPINAVSLSADARIAATVLSTVVASSDSNNVMIWDARTGRLRLRLGKHIGHLPVELSPDGRYVLTVDYDNRMARLWDTDTGACVRELSRDDQGASAMSISADVRTAAIALKNIGIWDLTTGRQLRTLTGHTRFVRSLSWSSDGRFLLSGAEDDTVRLWETGSGRCLRTFPTTQSGPWSEVRVLLNPDTGRPIVADSDTVRQWPLPSRYTAPPHLSRPRRHAELTRLDADATALVDAAEQAIAAHRYAEAHGLLAKARAIRGYERAPRALSAWRSLADVLPRVGVRASWQVREFDSQCAVDLSPDGARAASGELYALHVWDTRTGLLLRAIDHPSMVTAARFSPDQRRVASASWCGQLGVWSIDTGDCLMKIRSRENDKAHGTHFTADGRWALCETYDSLRLWDLDSGRCVRTIVCRDGISAMALSPDGRRAVTGVSDRHHTMRVWDTSTGECLHAMAGHSARIGAVALSPDGAFAVSGDDQKTIRLWDIVSGRCVYVISDLPDRPWSVQFVCDGRFVMTGGAKGTIQIWDPHTGRCLHTVDSGSGAVTIAPTPDGRFALSDGGGVPMRLWEIDWDFTANSA